MNGKKLLILGANVETISLVETAKRLGVITYVTDYNPNAPAKKIADVAFDIDCMNVEALTKLCIEEKIDGVMVGVADSLVKVYAKLCQKLNYPCYATTYQANILSNKKLFDDECKKFDIPTIPNYQVDLDRFVETEINIIYPVFVKPVDGNSGLGMSICHNKQELYSGIKKAISISRSGKYLVEKYMECDDIFLNYTFINGKPHLSAIANRFTIKQGNNASRVCVGAVYSDKYLELYKKTIEKKLFKLFTYLGLKNGVLMISAFVENNTIHLYDPGFRLQGEAPDIHIAKATGFEQKEFLINVALGYNYDKPADQLDKLLASDKTYATIWILLKEGKITKLVGLEELIENRSAYKISQRMFLGDTVDKSMVGTERQVFARIYCDMKKEVYKEKIAEIKKSVQIFDELGAVQKVLSLLECKRS